jgi:hypothetical protein
MNGAYRREVRIFPTDLPRQAAPLHGPLLCRDCGTWPAPRLIDQGTKAGGRLCEDCWQTRQENKR